MGERDDELESAEELALRKAAQGQDASTFGLSGLAGSGTATKVSGFGACAMCVQGAHMSCKSRACTCACRTRVV